MAEKVIETPHPLIDSDPHFTRVVGYFRPSDYFAWAAGTAAFPGALKLWDLSDPSRIPLKTPLRFTGLIGFVGGFLFAYQRSSLRFWGWTENKREYDMDMKEMTARAKAGLPLWGQSDQSGWMQGVAYRASAYSQLKLSAIPWFNTFSHPYHGRDPAEYGVKTQAPQEGES